MVTCGGIVGPFSAVVLLAAACSYLTPFLSTLVSCAYLKVMPGSQLAYEEIGLPDWDWQPLSSGQIQ